MKKIVILAICAVFWPFGSLAQAGFVKGIPSGWVCTGSCNAPSPSGNTSTSSVNIHKDSRVSNLDRATNGSPVRSSGLRISSKLVSTTFTVAAGNKLEFYFNYMSTDGAGFGANGWTRLLNASYNKMAALLFTIRTKAGGDNSRTQEPIIPKAPIILGTGADGEPIWSALDADSGICYSVGCGYTDWELSSYAISTEENYRLEDGATNVGEEFNLSIALNNLNRAGQLANQPSTVPIPAAIWLFGTVITGLGFYVRRKQQS